MNSVQDSFSSELENFCTNLPSSATPSFVIAVVGILGEVGLGGADGGVVDSISHLWPASQRGGRRSAMNASMRFVSGALGRLWEAFRSQ